MGWVIYLAGNVDYPWRRVVTSKGAHNRAVMHDKPVTAREILRQIEEEEA